jgi:hypothetical protein
MSSKPWDRAAEKDVPVMIRFEPNTFMSVGRSFEAPPKL